jgi:hypothetical protein
MPSRKATRRKRSEPIQAALSLKVEASDRNHPHVDADEFLTTAKKWLQALKTFADEQGQHVKWEIVDLRHSSALIEVQPVKLKNHKPVATLVKKWDEGLRRIEKTGRPPAKFTPVSLAALADFVSSIPQDSIVSVGNGVATDRIRVTALTQRRVEEAASRLPIEEKPEYVSQGSARGRLAVLDSWDPGERSFRLQLPLAPNKPVRCTYRDASLVTELGEGFEGMVEITGQLRYKPDEPWPYAAVVDRIRVLPRTPEVSLRDLVGLIHLPEGQDSVSYIRSVRDAE